MSKLETRIGNDAGRVILHQKYKPEPPRVYGPAPGWPGYKAPWPAYMTEGREGKRALIEEAMRRSWFHSIDLGGGNVTPGPEEVQIDQIQRAFMDIDFAGKAVLDTGCWDGLWSFEAEKRGASEVWSTDLVTQRDGDVTSYQLVHDILNSRAHYLPNVSVYDLHTLPKTDFDVVFYTGIFYHVKDPLLALARLRQVTKEGGLILVEGEILRSNRSYAEFYYRDNYAESTSNWWIPSTQCLREWVESSYFEIVAEYAERDGDDVYWTKRRGYGRYAILARATPLRNQPDDDPKNFFSRYDFLDPK